MSKSFVHFTCCLMVVFTMCIDEGNGNWKKKYRENLQKDIAKFKEMAEKIEDEIEDFYDEYSDDWPKHEYFTDREEKALETADYSFNKNEVNDYGNNLNVSSTVIGNITNNLTRNEIPSTLRNTFSNGGAPKFDVIKEITSTEKANVVSSKWPKFEDILQDMGKKYDWKNDRWIKVKKKANQSSEENHLMSHERHKFSYKTVKLNRSKSRRNVVIAVTAVR
ncbi:uncharacterized protein [Choristoneura fumiferana]|uniref:uncharacterized protein n=1 Tax=Choristoneura fumiferana TaxID=7141 RepID=UPI003D15B72A